MGLLWFAGLGPVVALGEGCKQTGDAQVTPAGVSCAQRIEIAHLSKQSRRWGPGEERSLFPFSLLEH